MANIKRMQMGDALCRDARVEARKGFLGLSTNFFYRPTGSALEGIEVELTPDEGGRLSRIITGQSPLRELSGLALRPTENGNYLLELVRSRDGRFAALHLLRWFQLGYEPVAAPLLLEGEEAQAAGRIVE